MSILQTEFSSPVDAEMPRPHTEEIPDDVAAPYGRKEDGTPRSKPGRKPGTPNSTPRARATRTPPAATVPPPAPRPRPTKRAASKARAAAAEPDYRSGLLGLAQTFIVPMTVAGIKSEKWMATAAVTSETAPQAADVLHDLALERPEFAAMLDRVIGLGPYAAVSTLAITYLVQVATIHGWLPPGLGEMLGARPTEEILDRLRQAGG